MTDQELQMFEEKLKQAKKEISELRTSGADQRKRYFKIVRDLASHCVDDRGRVHWDFLEQALNEDGLIIMIPYPADGIRGR